MPLLRARIPVDNHPNALPAPVRGATGCGADVEVRVVPDAPGIGLELKASLALVLEDVLA